MNMSDYALELLIDQYDFVCEQLCEMEGDEDITLKEINELKARRNLLQEALMKMNGVTYDDLRK
jgi:hypothetical protein